VANEQDMNLSRMIRQRLNGEAKLDHCVGEKQNGVLEKGKRQKEIECCKDMRGGGKRK